MKLEHLSEVLPSRQVQERILQNILMGSNSNTLFQNIEGVRTLAKLSHSHFVKVKENYRSILDEHSFNILSSKIHNFINVIPEMQEWFNILRSINIIAHVS